MTIKVDPRTMPGDLIAAQLAYKQQLKAAEAGLRHLRNRGGRGDHGVAMLGGEVMTVADTLARKLAGDIVEEIMNRPQFDGKALHEVGLVQFIEAADSRAKGRATTGDKIMAEIGRMRNRSEADSQKG